MSKTPSAQKVLGAQTAVGAMVVVMTSVMAPIYLTLNQFEGLVEVQTEKSKGIDDCNDVYFAARNIGPGAITSG